MQRDSFIAPMGDEEVEIVAPHDFPDSVFKSSKYGFLSTGNRHTSEGDDGFDFFGPNGDRVFLKESDSNFLRSWPFHHLC